MGGKGKGGKGKSRRSIRNSDELDDANQRTPGVTGELVQRSRQTFKARDELVGTRTRLKTEEDRNQHLTEQLAEMQSELNRVHKSLSHKASLTDLETEKAKNENLMGKVRSATTQLEEANARAEALARMKVVGQAESVSQHNKDIEDLMNRMAIARADAQATIRAILQPGCTAVQLNIGDAIVLTRDITWGGKVINKGMRGTVHDVHRDTLDVRLATGQEVNVKWDNVRADLPLRVGDPVISSESFDVDGSRKPGGTRGVVRALRGNSMDVEFIDGQVVDVSFKHFEADADRPRSGEAVIASQDFHLGGKLVAKGTRGTVKAVGNDWVDVKFVTGQEGRTELKLVTLDRSGMMGDVCAQANAVPPNWGNALDGGYDRPVGGQRTPFEVQEDQFVKKQKAQKRTKCCAGGGLCVVACIVVMLLLLYFFTRQSEPGSAGLRGAMTGWNARLPMPRFVHTEGAAFGKEMERLRELWATLSIHQPGRFLVQQEIERINNLLKTVAEETKAIRRTVEDTSAQKIKKNTDVEPVQKLLKEVDDEATRIQDMLHNALKEQKQEADRQAEAERREKERMAKEELNRKAEVLKHWRDECGTLGQSVEGVVAKVRNLKEEGHSTMQPIQSSMSPTLKQDYQNWVGGVDALIADLDALDNLVKKQGGTLDNMDARQIDIATGNGGLPELRNSYFKNMATANKVIRDWGSLSMTALLELQKLAAQKVADDAQRRAATAAEQARQLLQKQMEEKVKKAKQDLGKNRQPIIDLRSAVTKLKTDVRGFQDLDVMAEALLKYMDNLEKKYNRLFESMTTASINTDWSSDVSAVNNDLKRVQSEHHKLITLLENAQAERRRRDDEARSKLAEYHQEVNQKSQWLNDVRYLVPRAQQDQVLSLSSTAMLLEKLVHPNVDQPTASLEEVVQLWDDFVKGCGQVKAAEEEEQNKQAREEEERRRKEAEPTEAKLLQLVQKAYDNRFVEIVKGSYVMPEEVQWFSSLSRSWAPSTTNGPVCLVKLEGGKYELVIAQGTYLVPSSFFEVTREEWSDKVNNMGCDDGFFIHPVPRGGMPKQAIGFKDRQLECMEFLRIVNQVLEAQKKPPRTKLDEAHDLMFSMLPQTDYSMRPRLRWSRETVEMYWQEYVRDQKAKGMNVDNIVACTMYDDDKDFSKSNYNFVCLQATKPTSTTVFWMSSFWTTRISSTQRVTFMDIPEPQWFEIQYGDYDSRGAVRTRSLSFRCITVAEAKRFTRAVRLALPLYV